MFKDENLKVSAKVALKLFSFKKTFSIKIIMNIGLSNINGVFHLLFEIRPKVISFSKSYLLALCNLIVSVA